MALLLVLVLFSGLVDQSSAACAVTCGTPATGRIDVTECGADPTGATDSTDAFTNAICNARENGVPVYMPDGLFIHVSPITFDSVEIYGNGNSSQLHQTSKNQQGLQMRGYNVVIRNLRITTVVHNRTAEPSAFALNCYLTDNYTIDNIIIEPYPLSDAYTYFSGNSGFVMGSGGFWAANCSHGVFSNNFIHWTYADAVHFDRLCTDTVAFNNRIEDAGDDGIAAVGVAAVGLPKRIRIFNNTILRNHWGRGISAVGGEDIMIYNNYIETQVNAGIWVASETNYGTGVSSNVMVMNNVVKNTGVLSGSQCWAGASLPSIGTNSGYASPAMTGLYFTDNTVINSCTQTFAIGQNTADVVLAGNHWANPRGQGIQLRASDVSEMTVIVAGDTIVNATNQDCMVTYPQITGILKLFITQSQFSNCKLHAVSVQSPNIDAFQLTESGGSALGSGFLGLQSNATSVQWIVDNQFPTPSTLATNLGPTPPNATDFTLTLDGPINSPIQIDQSEFVAKATVEGGFPLALVAVYGKASGTALFDLTRTTVSFFPYGTEIPGTMIQGGSYTFNYVIASKDNSDKVQGISVGVVTVVVNQPSSNSSPASALFSPLSFLRSLLQLAE